MFDSRWPKAYFVIIKTCEFELSVDTVFLMSSKTKMRQYNQTRINETKPQV